MNLRLFTALWGNEAIETFKQGSLKSLLWPKNKAVLEGATWSVWTYEEHVDELERLIFNSIDVKFEANLLQKMETPDGKPMPAIAAAPYILHQPILQEMVTCLNSTSKLMMLPPDSIFGEGTLANMLKLGAEPGSCVSVPHMRVYPHILHKILDKPLSNLELATAAVEAMHPSWVNAEKGNEKTNSFWSGVVWERLNDKLISITHRIPTVYLASFTGQDHAFWQTQSSFGGWDHRWPGECLIRQGRQRLAGSSDACMIAEITGPGDNIPPQTPPEVLMQLGQDAYWTDTLHANHNRQTQYILRTE